MLLLTMEMPGEERGQGVRTPQGVIQNWVDLCLLNRTYPEVIIHVA